MTFSDSTSGPILLTSNALEPGRLMLVRKLKDMLALSQGWSFGEGEPVTLQSIEVAERFVLIASQLSLTADVFPDLDGGCAVAFYQGEERVEVAISADGLRLSLRAERGIGNDYEDIIEPIENASRRDIFDEVDRLAQSAITWKLYESSTYANTTSWLVDSDTSSITLLPLHGEGGCQSSSRPVPADP